MLFIYESPNRIGVFDINVLFSSKRNGFQTEKDMNHKKRTQEDRKKTWMGNSPRGNAALTTT